jgi:hypothetical protein
VTSRRAHGPPEDLVDDWGRLCVPVVFPPKRDSSALRHEQCELLLAAAGALRSPFRWIASDVLLAACPDLGWAVGPRYSHGEPKAIVSVFLWS